MGGGLLPSSDIIVGHLPPPVACYENIVKMLFGAQTCFYLFLVYLTGGESASQCNFLKML